MTRPAHSSWLFSAWLANRRTVHGSQFVTVSMCESSSVATVRRSSSNGVLERRQLIHRAPLIGERTLLDSTRPRTGAKYGCARAGGSASGDGDVPVHRHRGFDAAVGRDRRRRWRRRWRCTTASCAGTIEQHGGYVFATGGDGFCAAFSTAPDAAEAAVEIQQKLLAEPDAVPFGVRIGLHTGEATERNRDYFGPEVNRAARLMSTAHGGQIVVSDTTKALLRNRLTLRPLGDHRLRGLGRRMTRASGRRRWAPLGVPAACEAWGRSPATCLSS